MMMIMTTTMTRMMILVVVVVIVVVVEAYYSLILTSDITAVVIWTYKLINKYRFDAAIFSCFTLFSYVIQRLIFTMRRVFIVRTMQ